MSRFIPMRVASPREAQRLRAPSLNAPDGSASTLYRTWSNLGVFESYRSLAASVASSSCQFSDVR